VGWPHSEQNLAVGEIRLLQFAQTDSRAEAHCSQNFAPAPFSCWQFGQIIKTSKRTSERTSKKISASEGSVRHHRQQAGISDITDLAKARLASIAVMASGPGSTPGLFRAISDAVERSQGREAVFGVI
jgi:hypothetical protein